jgi:hypothetical protein
MSNNTKYGVSSLNNNTGSDNTAVGAYSSYNNLDGDRNTAVGSNSSFYNTTGTDNTALGAGSLCNNTTGSLNTAVGSSALEGALNDIQSVGDHNVAIGAQALYSNSGNLNTAIGTFAALGVTNGSHNTFLGANTTTDGLNTYNYSTAIGYNAIVDASSQIMMGGIGPNGYPNVIIPGLAQYTTYNPSSYTDLTLVPKEYVDFAAQGLTPKAPVMAATTGNIITQFTTPSYDSFSGNWSGIPANPNFILDGIIITDASSVLIKNQPDPTGDTSGPNYTGAISNGIFVYSSSAGTLTRRPDMALGSDALGALTFVEDGVIQGKTSWIIAPPDNTGVPIVVGINLLLFIKFASFNYKLGRGLDLSQVGSTTYLSVDLSLNFVNYLDSTTNAQPGGVTPGSGILNIGNNTTQTIIGPTGATRNPVQFTSGITGPTGSLTYLKTTQDALINTLTVGRGGGSINTNNTAVGVNALSSNTTTSGSNEAFGSGALSNNTTGNDNTAIGCGSLTSNQTGINNVAVGRLALNLNISNFNTAIGKSALQNNQTGTCNVAIGNDSAQSDVSGNFNTFLGCSTSSVGIIQNSTAIGYNSIINASNQMMLGGNNGSGIYPQVVAPGGITGATGSFTYLSGTTVTHQNLTVTGLLSAPGGITGATGSFTYLSGTTVSHQNLTVTGLLSAPGGITGATGSFTYLSATQGLVGNSTGLSGGTTNSIPYQISANNTSFITPPTTTGQILTYSGTTIGWTGLTGLTGASKWNSSGNNIYNNNIGNVGIGFGNQNPTFTLDVSGNARITGGITGPTGSFTYLSASQGITGPTGSFSNVYASGNIGIQNSNPGNTLDVSGNLNVDGFMNGVINNPGFNFLPLDTSNNFAQSWSLVTTFSGIVFVSVSLSASGQYQTAVAGTSIYISNNYGVTWSLVTTSFTPIASYSSVAVSDSGQYQTAVAGTSIYISNNYGLNWSFSYIDNAQTFTSVAVSGSGQYQSASTTFIGPTPTAPIYVSSNYGVSWTQSNPGNHAYNSVAISSSGQYQTALDNYGSGPTYYSTNYGVTWSTSIVTGAASSGQVAMSASGQYQTQTIGDNSSGSSLILYSTDYGKIFAQAPDSIGNNSSSISISASGQYQIATDNGNIHYSKNYGINWQQSNTPTGGFTSVSMSASGQYITAVTNTGKIYKSVIPVTSLTVSGLLTAPGGITGATGSFSYLTTSKDADIYGNLQILNTDAAQDSLQVYRCDDITVDPSATYLYYNKQGTLGTTYQNPSTGFIWSIDNSGNINTPGYISTGGVYYFNTINAQTVVNGATVGIIPATPPNPNINAFSSPNITTGLVTVGGVSTTAVIIPAGAYGVYSVSMDINTNYVSGTTGGSSIVGFTIYQTNSSGTKYSEVISETYISSISAIDANTTPVSGLFQYTSTNNGNYFSFVISNNTGLTITLDGPTAYSNIQITKIA